MPIRYIDQLKDLKGKKVFIRVDFNVPQDDKGNITEATRIIGAVPTIKYAIEHGAKVVRGCRQIIRAEEHPREEHQHEGDGHPRAAWQLAVKAGLAMPAFKRQERSVVRAPNDEVPFGAVPQPAQEHHDAEVDVGAGLAQAIASKGQVEVIPQHT